MESPVKPLDLCFCVIGEWSGITTCLLSRDIQLLTTLLMGSPECTVFCPPRYHEPYNVVMIQGFRFSLSSLCDRVGALMLAQNSCTCSQHAACQYPGKSNLGEKGFILVHSSRLWVIIADKSRWQELEAAAHIESAVAKQEVMSVSW